MKINLEEEDGDVEFSVGATRYELYGFGTLIIAAFSWICKHFI